MVPTNQVMMASKPTMRYGLMSQISSCKNKNSSEIDVYIDVITLCSFQFSEFWSSGF